MPYSDSTSLTASVALQGVWIHQADGGFDFTVYNFPYGENARDTTIDAHGAGAFYAGRTAPVMDFGEHLSTVVSCAIDIPNGSTYRTELDALEAFARSKVALWFRDNRSRVIHGVMEGFKHRDAGWGSTVTFTIREVDRKTDTVVA